MRQKVYKEMNRINNVKIRVDELFGKEVPDDGIKSNLF